MPRRHTLAIHLGPPRVARARFPYAPYRHFWGTEDPSRNPDVWAPTDLGRIVLRRGIRVGGRVLDTQGRPVGGVRIEATAMKGQDRHSTTTEADGTFAIGPLRPGNYVIHGAGQYSRIGIDYNSPTERGPVRPIRPVQVFLKEGETPAPVVLQEPPSIQVEVRFIDSAGRPSAGGPAALSGTIPNEGNAALLRMVVDLELGLASSINDPEAPEPVAELEWTVLGRPDRDGRVVFAAPVKLQTAMLCLGPSRRGDVYRVRLTPEGPLQGNGNNLLGALEEDRQVTVVGYREPKVVVRVEHEDGSATDGVIVRAIAPSGRRNRNYQFRPEKAGWYRSIGLLPDQEYEIYAMMRGTSIASRGLKRVKLAEGATAELKLTLKQRPGQPVVGQPAPAFAVLTLDGKDLSLESLRGKTVLIHFWTPSLSRQLDPLKLLQKRFAGDDRFAMVGFCLDRDADAARKAVEFLGITWPQAVLRDREFDPIVVDYGARQPLPSYLIGPDGKLLAVVPQNGLLEKAVADALVKP